MTSTFCELCATEAHEHYLCRHHAAMVPQIIREALTKQRGSITTEEYFRRVDCIVKIARRRDRAEKIEERKMLRRVG